MHCRYCGRGVTYPRRTFCSDSCVHNWRMLSSRTYARQQVFLRDKGICHCCGVDTSDRAAVLSQAAKTGRTIPRHRKTYWDMHHIDAVSEVGLCGLDGLQTLCLCCHQEVTEMQRMMPLLEWEDIMAGE